MTKKEERPANRKEERENHPKNLDYNPDITSQDKEVLNNQSKDKIKGEYFKEREEPIDFVGNNLDVPIDEQQFNDTANKPSDSERNRKPKDSADTNENLGPDSETIYKNEDAEKYNNPSKKSRKKDR